MDDNRKPSAACLIVFVILLSVIMASTWLILDFFVKFVMFFIYAPYNGYITTAIWITLWITKCVSALKEFEGDNDSL